MNATTWIKIFQKSGSENRPLIQVIFGNKTKEMKEILKNGTENKEKLG